MKAVTIAITNPMTKIIFPIVFAANSFMEIPICIIAEKQKAANATKNASDFLPFTVLIAICNKNGLSFSAFAFSFTLTFDCPPLTS
jgi:glycopeptide antibiotics resistance protein